MNNSNQLDDSNPFADPSVQKASHTAQIVQSSKMMDDSNPFAQQNFTSHPPAASVAAAAAAIIPVATKQLNNNNFQQPPTVYSPPPAYSASAAQQQQQMNNAAQEVERQKKQLEDRAAELERRERMLNSAPGQPMTTNQGINSAAVKNFPPMPAWCPGPLRPCFYQDISVEIPVKFQRWVRILFYLWTFNIFALFLNMIAGLTVFIVIGEGTTFGLSLLYVVLFTPLSFICWFRPIYKGFKSDSSVNFMLFFFVFFIHAVINGIAAIGFKSSGFCGLILASSMTKDGISLFPILLCWLMFVIFVLNAVLSVLLLIKVHRLYRSTGASLEQAQRDLATSVVSNKSVQKAAVTAVTESAKAAVQQQAGGASGYGSGQGFI